MFKAALAKIGTGLLMGIGFGIAVSAIWYGLTQWQMSQLEDDMFKSYGADAKLSITSHRARVSEAKSDFIGQIVNGGTDTWQSVYLLVELFGKDGQFIDKCSDHMDGSLAPGETRNFKVSCHNCRDSPMPQFNRYEVKIVNATFVPPRSGV